MELNMPHLLYHGTTVYVHFLDRRRKVTYTVWSKSITPFSIETDGILAYSEDGLSTTPNFSVAVNWGIPRLEAREKGLEPLELVVYEIQPLEKDIKNGIVRVRPSGSFVYMNPKVPREWLSGKYVTKVFDSIALTKILYGKYKEDPRKHPQFTYYNLK